MPFVLPHATAPYQRLFLSLRKSTEFPCRIGHGHHAHHFRPDPTPSCMNQDISPLATKILHLIRLELLETHPDFSIDSNLFDAGLDSMAIMQLSLLVERDFGISIPETRIVRATFSSAKSLAQVLVQLGASPS